MATSKKKPAAKKVAAKKRTVARKAISAKSKAHAAELADQLGLGAASKPRTRLAPVDAETGELETTAAGAPRRERVRLDTKADEEGSVGQAASTYFANVDEKEGIFFVSSGASIIDAIFGGGYALGRVVNIVGDKSAGKTLLAIEACANFHHQLPKGLIRYAEAEAAFDEAYAEALGMPVSAVDFGKDRPVRTVEDWSADLEAFIAKCTAKRQKGLYIIDSFDALSDDAEAERDITANSFGASKAKKSGELFRRLTAKVEEAGILLIVISQLRDKIGVTFGEKQTRSGGRALDFYASLIVWLREKGKIKKTMATVERVIGVDVLARVKKNKVGLPFRECEYPILFGYGIDDMTASAKWLISVKRGHMLKEAGMSEGGYELRIKNLRDKGGYEAREARAALSTIVKREWRIIEQGFLPKAGKY